MLTQSVHRTQRTRASLSLQCQESLILEILGKDRAEQPGQLQMALKYMSELKSHNLAA